MKNKIIYLDIVNDKPILFTKTNVQLEEIDIVNLFKNKYNKTEISNEQTRIMSKMDELINTIKLILIRLGGYKITPDLDNSIFEKAYIDTVIIAESDIEDFCISIGREITSTFNLPDCTLPGTLNSDGILYIYLEEQNGMMFHGRDRMFGYLEIYGAINHFLHIFNLFLSIKKMLNSFFLYLLEKDHSVDKKLNHFFLQYEYIVLFDLFKHSTCINIFTYANENGYDTTIDLFPEYCTALNNVVSELIFNNSKSNLFFKFKEIKQCLLFALENELKTCLKNKKSIYSFSDYLKITCLGSTFVMETNNTYEYLYDDCIIDFNYIFEMINGLSYAYYRNPFFLNSFITK